MVAQHSPRITLWATKTQVFESGWSATLPEQLFAFIKRFPRVFNSSQQLLQTWACHRFLIRGEVFIHDLSVQKSTFSQWWRRRCFILPPAHVTPAVTLNCTTTHSHSHDSFLAWPVAMVIRMPHGNNYSSLIKKTNTEVFVLLLSLQQNKAFSIIFSEH